MKLKIMLLPAGSTITLYLTDYRFVANNGTAPLDLGNSTCSHR